MDKTLPSIHKLNFEFYHKAAVSHKSMRCDIIFAFQLSSLQAFWPFLTLPFILLPFTFNL